jgi:hypothetical protein
MNSFIGFPAERQRRFYDEAQAKLGLPPASIEKDLWVCWTLRELFTLPEWGPRLTFKGGTSLAKAWKLIERFSEDIDVVVDRHFLGFDDTPSSKDQKRLVAECAQRIQQEIKPALEARFRQLLPASSTWSLGAAPLEEDRDQQTLLFNYPTVLGATAAYVRPVVKIEMGARSDIDPSESRAVQPYLAEAFSNVLGPSVFSVRTVAARRTFWEKAMLLHEETYRPPEKIRKARLARHYYDLWRLIESGTGTEALNDRGLFFAVVEHRKVFFRYSWMDYSTMRPGSIRLVPPDDQLDAWRQDYEAMRQTMFFGEAPKFEVILRAVGQFADRLNGM